MRLVHGSDINVQHTYHWSLCIFFLVVLPRGTRLFVVCCTYEAPLSIFGVDLLYHSEQTRYFFVILHAEHPELCSSIRSCQDPLHADMLNTIME